MSAQDGRAGGDRQASVLSFPCSYADESANYTSSCTKCNILLINRPQTIEFCNHWDHGLTFEELESFVTSKTGVGENEFHLALEEDGTIVSDVEYLQCLDGGTKLKMVWKDSRIEIDGATAGVEDMSVSPLRDEIAEADRKTLKAAAEKIGRNLGALVILSQDELQVLSDADENKLQLLMGLSSRRVAYDVQTYCFKLHSEREERRERADYLDLVMRANQWAQNIPGSPVIQCDGPIEADGVGPSPSTGSTAWDGPLGMVGGGAAVHSGDHADGFNDGGARERLVQKLREKAEDGALRFTVLMSLSEGEYGILLEDDCKNLKALNLPHGTESDAKRFCEEQLKLKENERKLHGYFGQHLEQKAC